MTKFERRQSMAVKYEMEERRRAASSGVEVLEKPDATQFIGASISEVANGQVKKQSINVKADRKGTGKANIPPPPLIDRSLVDPEFVEFTIVPILLRANVAYEEANSYGESLKGCTDAEVKVVVSNVSLFLADVKKCGIKLPSNFDKRIAEDMFWQNKTTNRKSFVYYKASEEADEERKNARAASSSTYGMPSVSEAPVVAVDANRFKVKSSAGRQSLKDDLEDLEGELEAIMREEEGYDEKY